MKKILTLVALMAVTLSAKAQHEEGDVTIQPRVGITISNITDGDKSKTNLTYGVDFERFFTDQFSVGLGVMFTNQGCKYDIFSADVTGDKKINDSINNGDVNSFIKACKENGVIEFNSLKRDPYLKKLSDIIQKDKLSSKFKQPIYLSRTSEEASVNNIDNFSVIYGAVAIVIAAVAVEAFIVIGTTTWVTHVHESSNKDIKKYKQYKNNAVEVWDLKNEGKTDFAITDKIDDAIIEEGFTIIKDNYPEVYNSIDKNTLRNLILLNVSKNLYYEN